jgi:hypothetical protein
VSGRVQVDPGISVGSGVVALLTPATAAQGMVRERTSLTATAASTGVNAWPYLAFQRAVDDFQKSNVLSAMMTGSDGKFDFPEEVLSGDYVVTIGVPITHDPGVGKPISRDWADCLLSEMKVKVLDREVTVPARNAWLLRVTVQGANRTDLVLGPTERLTWPRMRPTDDQLAKIRTRSLQLDPIRRKYDTVQKQFRDAEAKARQSGQPLDVRKAREREAEFKKEQESLNQANEELDQYLNQILPQQDAG